jgi:hypothetical protein
MTLIGVGAGRRQMEDDADAEFVCAVVPSDLRSPPGWAEAFARAADLVVGEAGSPGDVIRDYGRLAQIVIEEFPPSPERTALLERLAEREALALIAVGALRTH